MVRAKYSKTLSVSLAIPCNAATVSKNLIYKQFDKEVAQKPMGEMIEQWLAER